MTVYRNRRYLFATALAAYGLVTGQAVLADDGVAARAPSAWRTAQAGEPLRLVPVPRRQKAPPPTSGWTTTPRSGSAGATDTQPPFDRGDISVESVTLGEIDPDSVGLLEPDKGGLGAAMWRGTDRRLVERLLPLVPATLKSATLRGLAFRLLLSRATAPEGEKREKSLIGIRIDRLLALGNVGGAIALLEAGPPPAGDEQMTMAEVDSRFFNNDNAGACTRVRDVNNQFTSAYWQKATAYCLALSGEIERAAMIADILRERDDAAGDSVFFALVDALGGQEGTSVDSLPDPGGLQVSMMRAANIKLPANVVESQRLSVLKAAAFSPNADLDLRLQAAESLASYRAIVPAKIADLYNAVPFTKEELADPLAFAKQNWGPRGRALLVQAATSASSGEAKAKMLSRAWALAGKQGGLDVLLRASAPALLTIKPSVDRLDFARQAGLTLFALGNADKAMAWFDLALVNSQANTIAASAANALWPLAQMADPRGEMIWDDSQLDAWWRVMYKVRPKTARDTATVIYSLLEALGKKVPSEAWANLVGRPGSDKAGAPDAALWKALDDASKNGRVGETVLFSLIALGTGGKEAASAAFVSTIVAALRRVGLDGDARALALEAAIAAGA